MATGVTPPEDWQTEAKELFQQADVITYSTSRVNHRGDGI